MCQSRDAVKYTEIGGAIRNANEIRSDDERIDIWINLGKNVSWARRCCEFFGEPISFEFQGQEEQSTT